jgi:flagellar protein FlbD
MITLHRLGHPGEDFLVNHDMVVFVEANPDTVIKLTGGEKLLVAEAPAEVAEKMLLCRAQVMSLAMRLTNTGTGTIEGAGIAPPG